MKFFITVFVALFASAQCIPAVVNTGSSAVSRSDDGFGNYAFGYNEDHATGGTFRKEQGGPGVQVGSYGLRDADGRVRTVNYVADALGFRASISTNEPGVDPLQSPAAASVNGAIASVPMVNAAPIYAAAPIATHHAPIYAKSYAAVGVPLASYSANINHGSYAAPLFAKRHYY
ncbi:hypothetical protein RDWZM_008632 [Blomia tropicalis]|uniref:Cuticle protein 14 n=1 Tax=Blomia tropicalis TaxID=40697 RepID=A0A9Q0M4V8_BLOTA|nr:hypothetical protein RDWZM_008632 [Blomia tropicalis]